MCVTGADIHLVLPPTGDRDLLVPGDLFRDHPGGDLDFLRGGVRDLCGGVRDRRGGGDRPR